MGMEVEERLLTAIDQLAQDGPLGEIRCLAALLACRGKVERRETGWQHPFRDFAERQGNAFQQQLRGLIDRGIVINGRYAIALNSYIISRNKDFVCSRCANRLFARAHHRFAGMLRGIPLKETHDLARLQSHPAESRALKRLGDRYWELRRSGLLVSSGRTNPHVFPSLRWVGEVPWAAAVALTLEQGDALTERNIRNDCGIAYHMAVAIGSIEIDSSGAPALTPQGREQAAEYIETAVRRRLRWISACRDEAMHLLLDELSLPLPAVWVDGTASAVDRTWAVQAGAPLRILLKDRQLRQWLRRLVRRLEKMGLAQLTSQRDGNQTYYFAPGAAQVAKDAMELPEERFSLPPVMQAQLASFHRLLKIARESDGLWRWRPGAEPASEVLDGTLRRLRGRRMISGPADDGAYKISDPDAYRWTLLEWLLDPITAFLTSLPEEELLDPASAVPTS